MNRAVNIISLDKLSERHALYYSIKHEQQFYFNDLFFLPYGNTECVNNKHTFFPGEKCYDSIFS